MNGKRAMYWILDGHAPVPVADVLAWASWIEEHKYQAREGDAEGMDDCRVGSDHIGESWVSTTFLGIDHSFSEDGPPILFETLVFGGPLSDEMKRYATWDEAEGGHAAMVARVRAASEGTDQHVGTGVVRRRPDGGTDSNPDLHLAGVEGEEQA